VPALITPTVALHGSWLEARSEQGPGGLEGSGLKSDDEARSAEGFVQWVGRLNSGYAYGVPATYWWVVEEGEYLGSISLRHRLTEELRQVGGHIGYWIRPSARGRGLATWALGAVLTKARGLGLQRVLLTCRNDNAASARTIERNGGVLEEVVGGVRRRYWIEL
jgi:predicted acetyltransferase